MPVLQPAALDAAFLSFDTLFQGVFTGTKVHWPEIATLVPSDTEEQRHVWLSQLPELRKWIGERQVNNLRTRATSVRNEEFESTFAIPRAKFEDDKIGAYRPAVSMLAERSALWPDKLVIDALKAGTQVKTFDGQYFFDTDHPQDPDRPGVGTAQANLFTSKALTADNYASVRATMMSYKDDFGVPLEVVPNLLIVPPALEVTARKILNAEFIGTVFGSNTAAAAETNVLKGTADVLVLPRLAGEDDTWYLACTSRVVKPLIFQQRIAPEFAFLNRPTDVNVFTQREFQFGVRARGAGDYGLWFLIAKATASA
jgi:phage major head subunit gpT-like protein